MEAETLCIPGSIRAVTRLLGDVDLGTRSGAGAAGGAPGYFC
jgi:hypothetical protein